MSKIIAIVSQKGGVGKSTTCRNLATKLANKGYRVLAIDCDNQTPARATSGSNCKDVLGIVNFAEKWE